MPKRKSTLPRISVYLPDSTIRRQIKMAAAKEDLSVSEYCLKAITARVAQDGEKSSEAKVDHLQRAVSEARRFQSEKLRGRVFTTSSADLIRESREARKSE